MIIEGVGEDAVAAGGGVKIDTRIGIVKDGIARNVVVRTALNKDTG